MAMYRQSTKWTVHMLLSGRRQSHKRYISEWLRCPAAQVYYHLLKRGFVKEDMFRLIKKCFDPNQQKLCTKAKYNNTTRLAYAKMAEDDQDIITAAHKKGCFIDRTTGLSEEKQWLRAAQSEIVYGSAKKGSTEAYNFGEGQSVTSVHQGKRSSADSEASKSLGKTMYEPMSEAASISSDNNNVESISSDSDDETGEKETGVRFGNMEKAQPKRMKHLPMRGTRMMMWK